jgi:cyclopropane fatty-acyl-phospholipid synthase-like methyltransferase
MNQRPDVPSPIDFHLVEHAVEWERTALAKRPWRTEFFQCFAEQVRQGGSSPEILELGSGPGFLAEHLLAALPGARMVLLDFSAAMHNLAKARLAAHLDRVTLVEKSFKDVDWPAAVGTFDAVVTNQAVHELRHKRYAVQLHMQARSVLVADGRYLVCDHYAGEDGMRNTDLYMTVAEQVQALRDAGFSSVQEVRRAGGLVLHSARSEA